MGIKLLAKPLGRPPTNPKPPSFSAGERNPIEGVFGQAKRAYGMNRITTKLRETSQTAIALSLLAVNLARLLARQTALYAKFCFTVSINQQPVIQNEADFAPQ